MIDADLVARYLGMKRRLHAAIADSGSGFQPSRRELSEGLAKTIDLDGETWTYSTQGEGYAFTHPRRRFRVVIGATSLDTVTSAEILGYLQAFTTHQNLNQLVVDMWLLKAVRAGVLAEAGHGAFRPA